MPSSDLLPGQQQEEDEAEDVQYREDPFYSSEDLQADASTHSKSASKHSATLSYASSTDARAYAHPLKSKYNPRYLSHHSYYSPSCPKSQPVLTAAIVARADGAYKPSAQQQRRLTHLRNRSTGTVMTTSSSATTRIRPVFFNDSPNSSSAALSAARYQPAEPYLDDLGTAEADSSADASRISSGSAGSPRGLSAKSRKSKHRLSASQPVVSSSSSRLAAVEQTSAGSRQVSDQSITSVARNFVFPTPPPSSTTLTVGSLEPARRQVLRPVPSGRRSSGKLPDSWFGDSSAEVTFAEKGKQRMASQHAIIFNTLDDESAEQVDESPIDGDDLDLVQSPISEGEVARPESELLADSRSEARRQETLRSLRSDRSHDERDQSPKGLLVQQHSFASMASSAGPSEGGNASTTSSSHYGHTV